MKKFSLKIWALIAVFVVFIGYLFFKFLKKKLKTTEFVGNSTVAPLIDDVTAESYANRLFRAMQGVGTNETEIDEIYTLLVGNNGNLQKVVTKFGVRPYGVAGVSLFDWGEKIPLKEWINRELSGKRLDAWNALFKSLGL